MTARLTIADGLSLPISAVTETFAILAKKGSGKTYTASVMAEEMLAAGQPVVALDPVGAWFGLRSSADGKKDGFPVVVFGGDHADLPLNPLAGEMIARAVVTRRFPAVIDLSCLRKGETQRFVSAFLEEFFRTNREPIHLFIDEADDLCPQKVMGDEARMVGAVEDVVKRGRKKGIGCTLITQRPADLNKQVLTQCEVLFALNISHPKDIAPIEEWVRVHADDTQARQMIDDLPTLPKGEGWVWSPSWLNVFKRVKVRKRHTFDSGATPEVGQTRAEPKKLAAVDVVALGEQMASLAEEAKANDPAALKKRVAELEKQLREQKPAAAVSDRYEEGRAAGWAEAVVRVRPLVQPLDTARRQSREAAVGLQAALESTLAELQALDAAAPARASRPPLTESLKAIGRILDAPARDKSATQTPKIVKHTSAQPSEGLSGPQQVILDTVWMLTQRGILPTRDSVARWLSIHPNGGSYGANLGFLRANGYLDGLTLTPKGCDAVREQPTGFDAALAALPDEPKRRILRTLAETPGPLSRDELAAKLGIHPNGGSYGECLGWLRTMGLITPRGPISLTDGAHR